MKGFGKAAANARASAGDENGIAGHKHRKLSCRRLNRLATHLRPFRTKGPSARFAAQKRQAGSFSCFLRFSRLAAADLLDYEVS
jgi:hypothetical protein